MIRRPHATGRLVEREPRGDRLAAEMAVRSPDEHVVDPPRWLVSEHRVRVAAVERVTGPGCGVPRIGEVHRLAAERRQPAQESDLVGVGLGVEVSEQHRRWAVDRSELRNLVGKYPNLLTSHVTEIELERQMR